MSKESKDDLEDFQNDTAGLGNQKLPKEPEKEINPLETSSMNDTTKNISLSSMTGIKTNSNALNHPMFKRNPTDCPDRLKQAYPDFFLLEANLAVSKYAKNLQDNKSAGTLFQTIINYMSVDSESRQNPVFTEYLALYGEHTYKHTYEAGSTELLYKPSTTNSSDYDIEESQDFDDLFAINQSPVDFSDTEQQFLVDYFYPTRLVREFYGMRDVYLQPAVTRVIVVAYDAPPMLMMCSNNLLNFGNDHINNNMIMDRSPKAKEHHMVYRQRPVPSLNTWDITMLAYLLSDVVELQIDGSYCTSDHMKFFPYMGSIRLRINNDKKNLPRSPVASRHVAIRIAVQLALWDIANPEHPYWSLPHMTRVLHNMVIDYSDSTSIINGKASTRDYEGAGRLEALFFYATERAQEIIQTLKAIAFVQFIPHMGPISKRSHLAATRECQADEQYEANRLLSLKQSTIAVEHTSAPLLTLSDLTMTPDVRHPREPPVTDKTTVTFNLEEQQASGISQQLFAS